MKMNINEEEYEDFYFYKHYTRIIINENQLKVKDLKIEEVNSNPLFVKKPTIDKIKQFYKKDIEENWSIDMHDFEIKYANLVGIYAYNDTIIFLEFNPEKYLELFNIKKENFYKKIILFAPFNINIKISYITYNKEKKDASISLKFTSFYRNNLCIWESKSANLCLLELFPSYGILFKESKAPEIQKFYLD